MAEIKYAKRSIDASALINDIQGSVSEVCLNAPYDEEWFTRLHNRMREIIAIIERQPSVEPERPKGRWVLTAHEERMKSVMISIRPEWVEKILSGEKTVEVRKTAPKIATPFKCYIYCTKGNLSYKTPGGMICHNNGGMVVVGEFLCDKIFPIRVFNNGTIQDWNWHGLEKSCVPYDDVVKYIGNNRNGYGWHISDLKIYDKPKELSEFTRYSEEDIRPCQQNAYYFCQHEYFDYGENTTACDIDFDGEACPYIKLKRPPQSWCYVEGESE